ncbi:fumarylacetoacetate hydrolase family protein [Variovorax sp. Sphag1AA]|uniref:fumarylacetoacetate hydrolase family protein n=1 Tax=Variovorax sp. Sphag1AA TaxID=2587027 RepID=UPI001606F9C9|nr:fumarylacetoacetate hydrolase family protein [Variovorax sp. Sphag1AA]MBB3181792.1 5-oxopent-3-ene-1,2,5-tricarboxylate decarboxylase/2-hydroxyhepta-2,4-diene-1,7-dioate isomerase [Variovorax sp. Sphag1AA]
MIQPALQFDVPPYRLSGAVYGTLLNSIASLNALGEAVNAAPYKAAPKAPVLYVKPRNTLAFDGDHVAVPLSAGELQVGASLGLVIGQTACRVSEADALSYLAGYTVVIDFSVPHDSFYRPSVRFKALDGSCVIGPTVVPASRIAIPDELPIKVHVDGALAQTASTGGMVRNAARLLADVTEFMTLAPGDVLLLGVPAGSPNAKAGQSVVVEIEGIGRLANTLVKEEA